MRGYAQRDGRSLGSELRSCFSPFVDQSILNYVWLCESACSLQRRFPIDDILLRSGDIRDQVAKLCEIAPEF